MALWLERNRRLLDYHIIDHSLICIISHVMKWVMLGIRDVNKIYHFFMLAVSGLFFGFTLIPIAYRSSLNIIHTLSPLFRQSLS